MNFQQLFEYAIVNLSSVMCLIMLTPLVHIYSTITYMYCVGRPEFAYLDIELPRLSLIVLLLLYYEVVKSKYIVAEKWSDLQD